MAREAPLELFKQLGYYDDEGNILPEVAASLKTIPQGAATTVWCATSKMLTDLGGVYCEDVDIAGEVHEKSNASHAGVCRYSLDATNAERLWKWSEQILGLSFSAD